MFGSKLKMFFCLCVVGCASRSFGSEAQRSAAEVLAATPSKQGKVDLSTVDLSRYMAGQDATPPTLPVSTAVAKIDKMLATLPLFERPSDQEESRGTASDGTMRFCINAQGGYYIFVDVVTQRQYNGVYMITVRDRNNPSFRWVLFPGWLFAQKQHYAHYSTSGTFGDVQKAFENIKDSFNQKK